MACPVSHNINSRVEVSKIAFPPVGLALALPLGSRVSVAIEITAPPWSIESCYQINEACL